MDNEKALEIVGNCVDPILNTPLKDLKAVRWSSGEVPCVEVTLGYPVHLIEKGFKKELQAELERNGIHIELSLRASILSHRVRTGVAMHPGVKNVICVASGKGGVGKSTLSVNVALALKEAGARVGLLDADIYGPSIPIMLGLEGAPTTVDDKTMMPVSQFGVEVNSIGLFLDETSPAIWRGPMASSALTQLFTQTAWNDLDYLIVDLPPGTGDIQLTLSQTLPLTAALIVTTPQDVAYRNAAKGLSLFERVAVPVLGVVENMAYFKCSACNHTERLFGEGAAKKLSETFGVPILGELPLESSICLSADRGEPTLISAPESEAAAIYRTIAMLLAAKVSRLPRDFSRVMPRVKVERPKGA